MAWMRTVPSSVITSKAANGYHFKTGQQKWPSRTEIVLPCRLLWWQVGFGAPAPRAALEHMAVVQQAVEHGAHGSRIAQQFAPVFDRAVGGQHGAGPLGAAHDEFAQLLGGGKRPL